ncbi:hypothetical protein [Longispora albida]|uniref:hypothetical protein n=1 Tax=Longispora albida TaxID=203523 RepID=UPI001B7F7F5A|nr:hypothetical protein [Longispora albida]
MERAEGRTCGRATRSGSPCKVRLHGADLACSRHASEQDRTLAEAYQRGWNEGFQAASRSSEGLQNMRAERLERRVADLERQLDEASRYYEYGGDQVVEVGRYAYRWPGLGRLEVGDRVLLPENWISQMKHGPGPVEGVVTKLGATYRGELSVIIGRAPGAG